MQCHSTTSCKNLFSRDFAGLLILASYASLLHDFLETAGFHLVLSCCRLGISFPVTLDVSLTLLTGREADHKPQSQQ